MVYKNNGDCGYEIGIFNKNQFNMNDYHEINEFIKEININIDEFARIFHQITTISKIDDLTKQNLCLIASKLNELINKTSKKIMKFKETIENVNSQQENAHSNSFPIKKSQYYAILTSLYNLLTQHHGNQNKFKDWCKLKIQQQFQATGTPLTNDELEMVIERDVETLSNLGVMKDFLKDVDLDDFYCDIYIQLHGQVIGQYENELESTNQSTLLLTKSITQNGLNDFLNSNKTNQSHEDIDKNLRSYQSKARKKAYTINGIILFILILSILFVFYLVLMLAS